VAAVSGPLYVALEGAEGSGKSTQAALLADALGAVLTRETGGTAVGARLREILHDTTVTDLVDRAEALIAAADRAQHAAHVVRPALAAGRHVVSDRSVHSTLAYQGYGRGLDVTELRRINDWALDGLWPARVILLDAPAGVLAARVSGRLLDRFEQAGDDFHRRVAAGFREMAAADPGRWSVVDADGDPGTVAKRVRAVVDEWPA
jgi:dTMP kinase